MPDLGRRLVLAGYEAAMSGQIETNELERLRPKVGGVEQERILFALRLPIRVTGASDLST